MRSIYYIATVVGIYRKVIDEYIYNKNEYKYNKDYETILRKCANRDSVVQFYNKVNDESCGYYNGRVEVSNQEFLGVVLDYKNNMATIEMRNYFKLGDEVEIFGPNHSTIKFKIEKIIDENNEEIEVVNHPMQVVKIIVKEEVIPLDLMRIKVDKI
jgi:putative protease